MNDKNDYIALKKFWCNTEGSFLFYFLWVAVFFSVCVPVSAVICAFVIGKVTKYYDYIGYGLAAVFLVLLIFFYKKFKYRKFDQRINELRSYGMLEDFLADFGRNKDDLFMNDVVLGDVCLVYRSGCKLMPYCYIRSLQLEEVMNESVGHYFINVIGADERFPDIRIPAVGMDRQEAQSAYRSLCGFIYERNPRVAFNVT